ncbi:MAG: laccase domain-containing protein [Spirochaetes bacterium]|nr:laccase domain-containing protein [Spirochaetota bacterium]
MVVFDKNDDEVYRIQSSFDDCMIGVIGKSCNTMDYAIDQNQVRELEKELLCHVTGIEKKKILTLDQLHGDNILIVNEVPQACGLIYGEADGLLTAHSGICLVIRTADCVPVFAYDPSARVMGAVHSGWRGTRLAIARKLVREMHRLYGSSYADIQVHILPSIGPSFYRVGGDVAELFPDDIAAREGGLYLDLWQNIERSLREEGIPQGNIFNGRMCVLEMNNEFFSHRGGDAGRNLNFGFMK